jgi:hypothetical protein
MTGGLSTLTHYLGRHWSRDQLAYLASLDAPLTGPRGLRRWLGQQDAGAFVKLYFPDEFVLDFAPVHRRFLADIDDIRARAVSGQRGVKLARAIPRGHAKTTFYSRVLPAHGFSYGWSPLTVLLGNTQTAAERLNKNLRETLLGSAAWCEDFPEIAGGASWGSDRIDYAGRTIVAFGVGNGAIRGVSNPVRPRLIIGDDLDDDQLVRSQVQLDAAIEWLNKSVLQLGDNVRFTSSFIFVGTVIRRTSIMGHLLGRPDFDRLVEAGVKRFADRQDLWAEWEAWFLERARDGAQPTDAEADEFYQAHKAEMLEGTQVLWDRPDAYYYLMVYRLAAGKAAFQAEIQNAPDEAGGALGRPAYIRRADLPPLAECERLAALDPTEKGGARNDLAAYVEVLFHPRTRRLFVDYVDSQRRSYKDTIAAIVKRLKDHQAAGVYLDGFWVEENAAGGIQADLLNERLGAAGVHTVPTKFYSSRPKAEKIEALAEYTDRGQLFVVEDVAAQLATEWEAWPHGRNDDTLDAVGTVVMQLKDQGRLDLVAPTGPWAIG